MDTDFQNLINRFKDFPVIERKPSFLEIAGFPSRETVWRNLFAFFFDPNECHGLKDLFLRSFFDAIGKTGQSTGDFDSMTVSTECQTSNDKYLDLLIRCNEFAIGIEMKVNADLYNDLEAYGKLVKPKRPDKVKRPDDEHKVVLSVRPCPARNGFTNLLYPDLIAAIQGNLGDYILGADPKYTSFLIDFLTHVTSFIGGNAMDVDPKQLQFLKDNHETVKRLIDTHAKVRNLLEQRMAQIHDDVIPLPSLQDRILHHNRLFTYQGHLYTKFHVAAGKVRFWYQFYVTDDYCNATYFWVDQQQREYQDLDHQLKAAFASEKFSLSMPIEEVVAAVEKTILSMIAFLAEKQAVPAAQ